MHTEYNTFEDYYAHYQKELVRLGYQPPQASKDPAREKKFEHDLRKHFKNSGQIAVQEIKQNSRDCRFFGHKTTILKNRIPPITASIGQMQSNGIPVHPNELAKILRPCIEKMTALIDFRVSFSAKGGGHSYAQMLADATGCAVIGYHNVCIEHLSESPRTLFTPQNKIAHHFQKSRAMDRFNASKHF